MCSAALYARCMLTAALAQMFTKDLGASKLDFELFIVSSAALAVQAGKYLGQELLFPFETLWASFVAVLGFPRALGYCLNKYHF